VIDIHLLHEGLVNDNSGLEVARRASEKGIPCIVITALASVDLVRGALLHTEVEDFIQKKDGPEAVLRAIRRLQGLTILHLSDIHFQQPPRGEPFDQRRAYQEFLEDVRKQPGLWMHPIAAVVVSGDISFRCEPESFEKAEKFLKNLARDLRVPRRRIILSPGNHDVERRKAAARGDTLQAIRLGDADWFGKFDAFSDFTARFYGHPAFTSRRLYRPFDLDGRVSIVAFNSCMVEGDTDWRCKRCKREHYPGWIHHQQVEQAGADLTRHGRNGLRIGVFHHHILPEARTVRRNACRGEDLINYFDPQQRLEHVFSEQGFRILLHGHWHKIGLYRSHVVGSRAPLRFGSGAFWTTGSWSEETANYLLLQLSPLKGRSRVLMRRYTPATRQRDGFWGADASIRPDGVVALPEDIIIPAAAGSEEQ
jgi:3',5'-cyclic AMP phosphodiesterase CpdA